MLTAHIRKLFPSSLAGITAQFTKTISKLHAHAEHHEAQAEAKQMQAERLFDDVQGHDAEADTARNVASKIASLFN